MNEPHPISSGGGVLTWCRTTGRLLHCVGLFVLLSWMARQPLWHTDLWDHVNYGRHLIHTRQLPATEPLLPLSNDVISHSAWGSQWIFAQLEAIPLVGLAALKFTYALCITVSVGLISLSIERRRSSPIWGMVAGLTFLWVNWEQFRVIRPQMFGVVFFSLTATLLYSESPLRRRHCGLIAGVFLIWVNLHGSFATGLALIGTYLTGQCLDIFLRRWRADEVIRSQSCRMLVALLVTAVLASMLNPRGPLVFLDVIQVGLHPNIRSMFEWDPLSLNTKQGKAVMITGILTALALFFSPRRKRAAELLPLLLMAILTVLSARMVNWLSPLIALVLGVHGSAAIASLLRVKSRDTSGKQTSLQALFHGSSIALIACVSLFQTPLFQQGVLGRGIDNEVFQLSPVTPASTLQFIQSDPGVFDGLVFMPAEWTGYLMRFGPAEMRPMVNLHVHLIPPDVWQDYIHVIRGREGWDEILQSYEIDAVVTDRSQFGPLIHELRKHSNFRRIHNDKQVEIFVRIEPPRRN